MCRRTAPSGVMLAEHEQGRGYIRVMSVAFEQMGAGECDAAQQLVRNGRDDIALLKDHIDKQDNVLFVMGDRLFSNTVQEEVCEGFEKIEAERIGAGRHEAFHVLLEELSALYGG